jgi:hypothetical protein
MPEKLTEPLSPYLLRIFEVWPTLGSGERKVIIEWHYDMYVFLQRYLERQQAYIRRIARVSKKVNPDWRAGVLRKLEMTRRLVESLCTREYTSAIRSLKFTSDGRNAIQLGELPCIAEQEQRRDISSVQRKKAR